MAKDSDDLDGPAHYNVHIGNSSGLVFQTRDMSGDINLHQEAAPPPLVLSLLDATVSLGDHNGVRVSPNHVLTCGKSGPILLDHADGGPYACVTVGVAEPPLLRPLDPTPGSPVLNWRTGTVCGVLGEDGQVQAMTDVDPFTDSNRANHRWLDLLSPEQLAETGWRHPGPTLRQYLEVITTADHDHEYEWAHGSAPPLSEIYLRRSAVRASERDQDEPDRISADKLADHLGAQVLAVPGAGKSSLVRHLASESAKTWLRDGVGDHVPVPIKAVALTRGLPLPDALADGVSPVLSHRLDRAALVELLRDEPFPDVPWLVLVDGLDEVSDASARAVVIKQIRDHRRHRTHRFLVTSRPLDPHELTALVDRKTTPTYTLELFTDDDLDAFVVGFLTKRGAVPRGHSDVRTATDDLLSRAGRTRLADLARVPLFATMLCVLYCDPDGIELPDNQTQLYQRFITLQLTRLRTSETLAALRAKLAGWGDEADAAIMRFAGRILRALEDISYESVVGGDPASPVELAVRWIGDVHVDDQVWADAVAEVLRRSGLFVQYGASFDYLHPTFGEYFAAARLAREHPEPAEAKHLLAPRWKWPWPHVEVTVFLAARWLESGKDLHPALRKMLWWPYRERNIGFLAMLHGHGQTLPGRLPSKTVEALARMVRRTSGSDAWHERAAWLHTMDPSRAAVVLADIATDRRRVEERRYEALRYLIGFAPAHGVDAAHAFVTDGTISRRGRQTIGTLLYEKNAALGEAFHLRLAETQDGDVRMLALEQFAVHRPAAALELATSIVEESESTDEQRYAAVREAVKLDRERGLRLLCTHITVAESQKFRDQAMDMLLHEDRPRLEALLSAVRVDVANSLSTRFDATVYLVRRLGHDSGLLTDLVRGREFPPEVRAEAAFLDRGSAAANRVLEDVIESIPHDDPHRMWAVTQLLKMTPQAAVKHLVALVENEAQQDDARLQAAMLVSRHVTTEELVALYRLLARSPGMAPVNRMVAAEKAMAVDRIAGGELMVGLATDSALDVESRTAVAATLSRARLSQQAFEAYRAIAFDEGVPDMDRVAAARTSRSVKFAVDTSVLQGLMRVRLSGPALLELARALDLPDSVPLLEHVVGDHDRTAVLRWDAAQQLALLDLDAGRRAMLSLATDWTVPPSIRLLAQQLAEG
jgi:hypothetical protein